MQKIFKNNKGSITLFVVLSVLFFLVIVTSVAVSLRNKESAVDAQYERVKAAYEKDVGNEKAVYEEKAQYGTVLLSGKELNAKMKQLAGNSAATYETEDTNISAIKRSETLPDKYKRSDHIVSESYSASPVYMWFENGTIWYYSSSKKIKLNKDSSYMFNNIKSARSIEIADSNTSTSEDRSYLDTSMCEDMSYLFQNCLALTELDVSNFDTSNVNNMSYMFNSCSTLTDLNLSNFNTSKVTTMKLMFYNCSKLTNLDLSSFNTSKVTTMQAMFYNYKGTTINVSSFNTSEVTTMWQMFLNCSNLTSLDLHNFNTIKVNDMHQMFQNCENLTELNINSFDTRNVTTMWKMFSWCTHLQNIDLSNFDMSNVSNTIGIIENTTQLNRIKTPKIYPSDTTKIIELPKTMYDYGENEYTQLTSTSPTKTELRSTKF